MKRRAFFGFLGGAAVAGPSVAKSAAQMTLSDLNLRQAGMAGSSGAPMGGMTEPADQKSYAKQALARFMGKTPLQRAREKATHYVDGLDPEVACLRSVALHSKVRMTRAITYERSQLREKTYLEGILAGWWE